MCYHGVLRPNAGFLRFLRLVRAGRVIGGGLYRFPAHRRLAWAALLARVFAVGVMLCPTCDGRLGLVAVLSDSACGIINGLPGTKAAGDTALEKNLSGRDQPIFNFPL